MAHDVFISYSSIDQPAALAVLHGLEAAGIRCWIAPRDIGPGAIWAQAIMDGIIGCRALVVVFSANANRSVHVLNEVDAAVRKGAVIVPFRIEDVMPDGAMEFHLRTRHWLDALTPDLERHVEQLAEKLNAFLASGATDRAVTPPPRPFPADLPRRRPSVSSASVISRLGSPKVRKFLIGGALALAVGAWWLSQPRPVRGRSLVVREVSSGGGNQSTLRLATAGLKFFEGSADYPPLNEREYASTFVVATTRYVKVELPLRYEAPGRVMRIPFSCLLQREGAQIISTLPLTAELQPAWTTSSVTTGFGNANPGSWEPGRYRVDCRYGDELVAREWFDVVARGEDLVRDRPQDDSPTSGDLGVRVVRFRFFESGNERIPQEQRNYVTRFRAGDTRYINTEVTIGFRTASSSARVALNCRYLRDRTVEEGRITLEYPIQPGETSRWASAGLGAGNAAQWSPGRYLVACDDGNKVLGQSGFMVE